MGAACGSRWDRADLCAGRQGESAKGRVEQRGNIVSDAECLTAAIRSVTDQWDEPLDEVHDIPQIVNAILASDCYRVPPMAAS